MINHITTLLLPYIHKSISFLLQFCSYVYSFIVCIWLISDTGKFFSKKRNENIMRDTPERLIGWRASRKRGTGGRNRRKFPKFPDTKKRSRQPQGTSASKKMVRSRGLEPRTQ